MPRKPMQERSKATVDAIIEAGFLCVAKHGLANTTTRHIADAAGIGVGSLYEYFKNKEAVYAAMNETFMNDMALLIRRVTPDILEQEVHGGTQLLLRHIRELLMHNKGRYLQLAQQLVQTNPAMYAEPVRTVLMDLVLQYLMSNPSYMQLRNIPTMSYIFVNAGIILMLKHLAEENPPITHEQLSTGLADLVSFYVAHDLAQPR